MGQAMDEVRNEWRAARAIARKELLVFRRYRLNAVNQVLQPLYQTLIPGVLLGATFAIGGQALGLAETTGTTDLTGYLFLGMLALNLGSAGFWAVASYARPLAVGVASRWSSTPELSSRAG